jgi:hypothetical protein
VNGCTDPAAFNYDASANTDDGSCIAVVNGCIDVLACNYDVSANTDDGSCILPDGCTDPSYLEYDASAICDDGSCTTLIVNGCTDPAAFNYDALANTDDGSCIAVVLGCIDSSACNYDILANTDDSSCAYPTSSSTAVTECDSYTWNGQTYTSSGNYTYSGTNVNGCDSTATLVLTINNSISLTNSESICFGENITVGNNTYSQSGTYTDFLTTVNGCDSVITTNLNVSQQINVITLQVGFDIKANTSGGSMPYVYEWNTGEITGQITPLVGGDYWVIVTDANGCISDSSFFEVDWISPSLIEDFNIDQLIIYPNPSRDIINIEFTSLLSQDLEIRIINSIGEIIYLENLENSIGEYNKTISLEEYPKAIYFLEIRTNDAVINKKLILQ